MNVLTADEFLNCADLDIVPVPLPARYGADAGFYVMTLSDTDRAELERRFTAHDPREDPGDFRATILLRCVCDAAGAALFSEAHRAKLMSKAGGTLELLFVEACRINGFTAKDVEDLTKN